MHAGPTSPGRGILLALGDDGVLQITLDRPAALNAVDQAMRAALIEAMAWAEHEGSVRVLVLTGAGDRAFCAGADTKELAHLPKGSARDVLHADCDAVQAVRRCTKPVLARVNGYALGTGLLLVMACDIAVARADAELGLPEIRRGTAAGLQAALLPRLVGRAAARRLALLGNRITAREACALGLLADVVEPDALDTTVAALASDLASLDPRAASAQKRICQLWDDAPLDKAIDDSIDIVAPLVEGLDNPTPLTARSTATGPARETGCR